MKSVLIFLLFLAVVSASRYGGRGGYGGNRGYHVVYTGRYSNYRPVFTGHRSYAYAGGRSYSLSASVGGSAATKGKDVDAKNKGDEDLDTYPSFVSPSLESYQPPVQSGY
ncbi:hypothetical protein Bpfe_027431 [Biomphalaria pfeifferi]|uniref:Uncharacterized protein n=1 Tax=Biomphalaria pfeifferi TaxID=112525 RepID=A0AAD8AY52_BIOPF|nr:hypothetical protein Bpfe_027431 [Biomphalaria pfeifferi]